MAAVVVASAGAAFVVGRDGTLAWQYVRVLVVLGVAWAVVEDLRRLHGARRASVVFAFGLVGLAAGVGIAGPHLAKTGWSATTVAATATTLASAVLVATGAAGLVRATHGWRRAPVAAGLLLALYVATWSIGQAVAATNVPPIALPDVTPADRGLDYEDVHFTATDRVVLAGWYVPSTNGAAVALLHGAGSTRAGVLDQAEVLAEAGYGVLLYDARGHGESDGRAMDFGWYGDDDVAGAVSFLARQEGVDPDRIGVVGMSMGGEQAIGAAAADPRIAAVVAEGAGHRVAADKDWLSDEFGFRGWLQEQLERLTYAVTDVLTEASPPIALRDAVADAAPRPVLLIAGGAATDEAEEAASIASGSPGSVEVWVVPGAGHTDGLDAAPGEWEARVIGFLDAALRSRPGTGAPGRTGGGS